MKNLVLLLVGIVGLSIVVFGADKTISYLRGTRQILNAEVDEKSPMQLDAARAKTLLEAAQERVNQYEDKVCDIQWRADAATRTMEELQKKLQTEKAVLGKVGALLDTHQEKYHIGGHEYTWSQVNADAHARVESAKRLGEDIQFQSSLRQELTKAAAQGQARLVEARKNLAEIADKLARLEAKNANADVQMEVAQLAAAVAGQPCGTSSDELGQVILNYERKVEAKKRRAARYCSSDTTDHLIDYSASNNAPDAAGEIHQLLGRSGRDDGQSLTPGSTTPAPEAITPGP